MFIAFKINEMINTPKNILDLLYKCKDLHTNELSTQLSYEDIDYKEYITNFIDARVTFLHLVTTN